jgi:hypothetical protein
MLTLLLATLVTTGIGVTAASRIAVRCGGTRSSTVVRGAALSRRLAVYQYAGRPMPLTRAVLRPERTVHPDVAMALPACRPA